MIKVIKMATMVEAARSCLASNMLDLQKIFSLLIQEFIVRFNQLII